MSPLSLSPSLDHAPSVLRRSLAGVPLSTTSSGGPVDEHGAAKAAAAAGGESRNASPICPTLSTLLSPRTATLLHHAVGSGEAPRFNRLRRRSASPLGLRNAVVDNDGVARSNAARLPLAAALKNAGTSAMAADSSPGSCTFEKRLRKLGCCAVHEKSSPSFLDAFQQALNEAAAQARLERAGRDDAERRLEQLQKEVREKRREASLLQQQISSLLRRCDTMAVQQKQHADEVAILRQQETAKRVEASLLREEVHDSSRKMENLRTQLDEAQQQLCVSKATLAKREMENEALVQQLASHRDKCAAFEEEIARLAQQMQADKAVTARLKEQLHALFHAEGGAGGEGLQRCGLGSTTSQTGACGSGRLATAERAALVELLLKRKNVKLTLKAQALQDKLESCEIREAKSKISVARLHEALEVEKLKNNEASQRELDLQQQIADLQQQLQQQHQEQERAVPRLKHEETVMSLSKQLGRADVDLARLQEELRKKEALLTKLTEKQTQLQQQVCEITHEVGHQRAVNSRLEEENLRLRTKIGEKSRRLDQQQIQHDAVKLEHDQKVQHLTNKLQETSATLCETRREANSKEEQLRLLLEEVQQLRGVQATTSSLQERCETSSQLLRIYKKENQQMEKKCETLLNEVQRTSKRVCMLQEELETKTKYLREAQDAEENMRLTLQQAHEGRSKAEEKVSYLEKDKKELLLSWQREWESQQQLIATLQAQQQQFEEELKLIKEEVEQRRLQHHEDITALEGRLAQQTKKELVLQAEVDDKVDQIRRLRASLDEHLAERSELLRGEKRARDELEEKLQLEKQKCKVHTKDKSELSNRCELLEKEVQRLNGALAGAAETARRCEELQQEKFHLQETLEDVEKEFKAFENTLRTKEEEISVLTHNQKEMHDHMQNERAKIEAIVPQLIDAHVKNKVSVLQRKFQQKMLKLKRRLADRTQYEERVREVVHAELQSLQRWNQEMEKWELLTRPDEAKMCPLSARGCPGEQLCCHD